jgi:AcrR family transcriptional regulator
MSKGELTRQRILEAAEEVFAQQSYAAARLEDVAQRVGIKRAAIVYYFRDKQELYDCVEAGLFEALENAIRARLATAASGLDKLLALVDSSLDFMVEKPSLARFILRNIADRYPAATDPVRYSRAILHHWHQIVADGQASGEFGPVDAMQLMQIVGGATLHFATIEQLPGEDYVYSTRDAKVVQNFRALLHKTCRHLVAA